MSGPGGVRWAEAGSGPEESLRQHVIRLLEGRGAHADFDRAVAGLQPAVRGRRPEGMPLPWGGGQTLLREALLLADHNAYHLGELVAVRRMLGAWPPAG